MTNLTTFADKHRIEDPGYAVWILFHNDTGKLSDKEELGLLLFDLLRKMSFAEAVASFIVNKVLDWAHAEIQAGRPGIMNLIDNRFLVYFGQTSDGFHAWDIANMRLAEHQDMTKEPLISVAVSIAKLNEMRLDTEV